MANVLPGTYVDVVNGQVIRIVEVVDWNGQFATIIDIIRDEDGYKTYIGDPSHGGKTREGVDLAKITDRLNPKVQAKYLKLFSKRWIFNWGIRRLFSRCTIKRSITWTS